MAKGFSPTSDRAALSTRARDHLHGRKTDFHALDYISMAVDLVFAFILLSVFWFASVASALGIFGRGGLIPESLQGPEKWEAALWIVLSITTASGLWGLFQYWLRRIWEKTSGSRASLWTGTLATGLFLGAVMPGVCLLMLFRAGAGFSVLSALFAVIGGLYLRHGLQVESWTRR